MGSPGAAVCSIPDIRRATSTLHPKGLDELCVLPTGPQLMSLGNVLVPAAGLTSAMLTRNSVHNQRAAYTLLK